MKKYQAIIFDLDGTLLDTLEDIAVATNEALTEFNFPTFPVEDYKFKVGGGFAVLVERCVPDGTSQVIQEEVLARLIVIYDKQHMNHTKPYPGIINMLDTLQHNGVPIAINTNKKQMYLEELALHYFPGINFVDMLGQREGVPTKPDPIAANDIQKQMGIPHDAILFVGDTNVDMLTAKAAHMDSVGVSWGFRTVEELKENGATYIVDNAKEILEFV